MPNPIDIVIKVSTQGAEKFDETGKRILQMKTSVEQAQENLGQKRYFDNLYKGFDAQQATKPIEEMTEAVGMTRREWMRTGSEASFYLTSIADKSGIAGQALAGVAGKATQLGETLLFGDPLGGIIAIAAVLISVGVAAAQASPEVQALNKQLDTLAKGDEIITTLAQTTKLTEDEARAMMQLAQSSPQAAAALKQLSESSRDMNDWEKFWQAEGQGFQFIGDQIGNVSKQVEGMTGGFMNARRQVELLMVIGSGGALLPVIAAVEGTVGGFNAFGQVVDKVRGKNADAAREALNHAQAAEKIKEGYKGLDNVFPTDAPAQKLAAIGQVSQETAEQVLSSASKHQTFNATIQESVRLVREDEIALASAKQGTGEYANIVANLADHQADLNNKLAQYKEMLDVEGVVSKMKSAIPQMTKEMESYNQTVARTIKEHQKAQAGFGKESATTIKDAAAERVKLETTALADIAKAERNLGNERAKINANLLEKLGDMEQDRNDKKSDAYYSYVNDIKDAERERTKSAEDNARAREQIERETIQAITDLDSQTSLKLNDAKTEHEAERIRYEADLERAKLGRDAQDKLSDLEQKKRSADEEFAYKRQKRDEDYAHAASIDDREYAQAIARLQRETQQQLQEAQKRTAEEIAQINARKVQQDQALTERTQKELASIRERAAEELANYKTQMQDQATAHSKRMADLTDLRSASEKYADDFGLLSNTAWAPWLKQLQDYEESLRQMRYDQGERVAHVVQPWEQRAAGGSVNAYQPYIVGERGPELFVPQGAGSIVPNNQLGGNGVTMGDIHINVNGAQSPRATAEEIRRLFNDLVRQ